MRDAQGNKIVKGNWLLWIIRREVFEAMGGRLMVRAVEVNEPRIEGNDSGTYVDFVFRMPIDTEKLRGQEPVLMDFYGLRSPAEEKAIEKVM